MSIWHKEVTRVNGSLMAYVEVQNDYTGGIRKGLKEIHVDGNRYFCRADGGRVDVTNERESYLNHESTVAAALKIYKQNSWLGGK